MRSAVLALFLVACSSTEPSSDPFAPVQPPAAPAPVVGDQAAPAEEFRISSEEMQKNAAEAKAEQLPSENPLGPPGAATEEPAAAAPVAEVAPLAEATPPAAPAAVAPVEVAPATPSPWPVRLVKTLPEAQPPRAILGLPDGTEIVVSPGSLIADQGLVVLSVGKTSLDLARVTAAGDHATIAPLTLTAQY